MIDIARRNIEQWFKGAVPFEGLELDITHERFGNILAGDYLKKGDPKTANLVLFLGARRTTSETLMMPSVLSMKA
jgi:hypothetical protein